MYLIVGRTASGKDYLGKYLETQGLKGVLSRTTRPKRHPNDDSHVFVTEEQAKKDEKLAYTEINGYQYYTTKEDLDGKDFYIIDPDGVDILTAKLPDVDFKIIYVICLPNLRKTRFLERGGSEEDFKARNISEADRFERFNYAAYVIFVENIQFSPNVTEFYIVENDYHGDFLYSGYIRKIVEDHKSKKGTV